MNKIQKYVTLALFVLSLTAVTLASAELNGEGDWQYWSTYTIEGQLTPKLRAEFEEEFRFGDDISDFYREHTQLLFGYKLLNWLEIAPAFREIFEEKKGVFRPEHRPQVDLTGKWTIKGSEISDRNRLEYRDKSGGSENTVRYRNQVKVKLPFSWTQWKIRPYAAEEVFFESEGAGFNRNRLSTGLEAKLWEHLKGEIYFLWQTTDSNDDWINNYILGTKLKFAF